MPDKQKYKIAVIADPLYKKGGAEVHLKYILDTFDKKTLFTAFYDKEFVKREFPNVEVKASFMQYLPWKFKLKHLYKLLQPLAYSSFNFKGYNAIVSLSISFAKFAHGNIPHINICMSPPKFLWEKEKRSIKDSSQLKGINRILFKIYSFFENTIIEDKWRNKDKRAAQRVDRMIAISNTVKERIRKYYEIDSDVIYPPVDVTGIEKVSKMYSKENWFLYLGRVEAYKGVELAIRAAYSAKVPLKIGGVGDDLERMKNLVKSLNAKGLIKFLGYFSDEEKSVLLAKAKALVFPVKGEDFGIIPVEANAAGTPVIAYRDGGVVETICDTNPKTGVFFDKYNYKALAKILKTFPEKEFKPDNCRKQAAQFASEIFQYKLKTYIEDVLKERQTYG